MLFRYFARAHVPVAISWNWTSHAVQAETPAKAGKVIWKFSGWKTRTSGERRETVSRPSPCLPPLHPCPSVRSPSNLLPSSPSCIPHFTSATVHFLCKIWTNSEGEKKTKRGSRHCSVLTFFEAGIWTHSQLQNCDRNLINLCFVRQLCIRITCARGVCPCLAKDTACVVSWIRIHSYLLEIASTLKMITESRHLW